MAESIDNKPSITRFGEKLRTLRRQRQMTLQELARATGHIAHGYISELERGKKPPTVEFVIRLARLFNVTTDELLKDELELKIVAGEEIDATRRSLGSNGKASDGSGGSEGREI
jgi:transcriptional regulator with XRE-family HTH domain